MGAVRPRDMDNGGRPSHTLHCRRLHARTAWIRHQYRLQGVPRIGYPTGQGQQDAPRHRSVHRERLCSARILRCRHVGRQLRVARFGILSCRQRSVDTRQGARPQQRCQAFPPARTRIQALLLKGERHAAPDTEGRIVPHTVQSGSRSQLRELPRIPRRIGMELHFLCSARRNGYG